MQSLDVISVNLWLILISLANLVILFLIVKRFLFKPVNKMLADRQSELDKRYNAADEAVRDAEEKQKLWNKKMVSVKSETEEILKKAQEGASRRSETIVSDAKEQADSIIRQAKAQAELERKKSEEEIKQEIVEVSTAIANKIIEREVSAEEHRRIIDSFIEKIGEEE